MDRFLILLDDLGGLIQVPLQPDAKRGCRLNIDNKLHIQIEDQDNLDRLLVSTFICEVPPGKFRETVFKETLKENGLYPRLGTFAYSPRNNMLTLFAYAYYPGLDGSNFADFLTAFIEKSLAWKSGVETGQLPQRAPKR